MVAVCVSVVLKGKRGRTWWAEWWWKRRHDDDAFAFSSEIAVLLFLYLCHRFCCVLFLLFSFFASLCLTIAFCHCRMLSGLQYKVIQCSISFSIFISAVDTLNSLELFYFSCAAAVDAMAVVNHWTVCTIHLFPVSFCYTYTYTKKTWTLSESLLFFSHSLRLSCFRFCSHIVPFFWRICLPLASCVSHHISSFDHIFMYIILNWVCFLLFHTIPTFYALFSVFPVCTAHRAYRISFANDCTHSTQYTVHSATFINFTGFGFHSDSISDAPAIISWDEWKVHTWN